MARLTVGGQGNEAPLRPPKLKLAVGPPSGLELERVLFRRGGARLRHAAADPVPEHDLRPALGGGRRRRGAGPGRPGVRGAGFGYVAVCDHVAIPRRPGRGDEHGVVGHDRHARPTWPPSPQRVRLLSHVYVLPYRHPLLAAKAWATLDALSGGRAILGVGVGHVAGEFAALGVPSRSGAACSTRPSTPSGPRSPTSTRPTGRLAVRRTGPAPTGAAAACPSGSAARRSRPCAAPPSGATGGCRRARPRAACEAGIDFVREHRAADPRATTRSSSARAGRSTSASRLGHRSVPEGSPTRSPAVPAHLPATWACDQVQVGFASESADELLRPDRARSPPRSPPLVND